MFIRSALLVLVTLWSHCIVHSQAQSIGVIGDEGLSFDFVKRTLDGGYIASHTLAGGEVLSYFDEGLQTVWTKQLVFPDMDSYAVVRSAAMPDGSVLVFAQGGTDVIPGPNIWEDSTDVKTDLVRVDPDGSIQWARQFRTRFSYNTVDYPAPMSVEVNDAGESMVILRNGSTQFRLMRISSAGEMRWMASITAMAGWVQGHVPDGSTDSYFTCTNASNAGSLTVGRIDGTGNVLWTKKAEYQSINGFVSNIGPDGHLLVAGKEGNNTFLLKLDIEGEPQWCRLSTTVPPSGPGVGTSISAMEATDDGYWILTSAGYPARSVIEYHALDGSIVAGQNTLTYEEYPFERYLQMNSLGSSSGQLTMSGIYIVHNTLFDQHTIQPTIMSILPMDPEACFMGNEEFAEMQVPLDELQFEDVDVISFMTPPFASDIDVVVVDLAPIMLSSLCAPLSVEEAAIEPTPRIWPNPVVRGADVRVVDGNGLIMDLIDATGKMVYSGLGLMSNSGLISTEGLSRGVYALLVRDRRGVITSRNKLVVE